MSNFCVSRAILACAGILSSNIADAHIWPTIKRSTEVIHFNSKSVQRLVRDIKDVNNQAVYRLTCQSGDLEDDDFNYSGLFQCRLLPLTSQIVVPSLFMEDVKATSDWEGRSRFLLNDVLGTCKAYQDWGARRSFRLRGMRITLEIVNVKIVKDSKFVSVESYDFRYVFTPNMKSTSAIAARSRVPEPAWFARSNKCFETAIK